MPVADALDYRVTPDGVVGTAPGSPLSLPTYDGSGQVVHPAVAFIPQGWNGHRYWMAATPYPGANDRYENPSLWVSDDGETWSVPPGVSNPIEAAPATGHNSDPHLAFGPDGRLYCFFQWTDNSTVTVSYRASSDGVDWSDRAEVWNTATSSVWVASPSLIFDRGQWHMWFVNIHPSPNTFEHWVSDDLLTWAGPDLCTFAVSGQDLWHPYVMRLGAQFVCVMNTTLPGTTGGSGNLYLGTSLDGLRWNAGSTVCLPQSSIWYDFPYRAAIAPRVDDGQLGLDLWFSAYATSGPVWRIGRSYLPLSGSRTAGGDLAGTYPNPTVAKVNRVAVRGTPSAGQVITAINSTTAQWQDPRSVGTYHFEAILDDAATPILTNDGTDWVYGKVYDA